ncbi:hypothetical protein PanWU01x14_053410 [Parasponia andersonii]|uniref:Uncharacterized protein n=1 Tax=Parasponia andersonii TaxID=3476 RepID=A0A2P5DLG2_PARAD|nr:hypothetical protein PanWU01x14_053410 [Parasponia andersonii]
MLLIPGIEAEHFYFRLLLSYKVISKNNWKNTSSYSISPLLGLISALPSMILDLVPQQLFLS